MSFRRGLSIAAAAASIAMAVAPAAWSQADTQTARITIIIDDLGYAAVAGRRAIELPGPLVYAVLPDGPHAKSLARLAHARGKEVLLHLPLQSTIDTAGGGAEPSELRLDMSERRFKRVLRESLERVPHALGVNNHRGSLLTRHPGHMAWLMEEVREHGLIFVDSRTTHRTVAQDIAREFDVPATRRDVFLDDDPSPEAIAAQFLRLKRIAWRRGDAVGIGHPYPTTLEFLETALPALSEEGFELIGLSELIANQHDANPRRPGGGAVTSAASP